MSQRLRTPNPDRRLALYVLLTTLVLIIGITLFAPRNDENDLRPTTFNNGPAGARAAFLALQALGRKSTRWERPLDDLSTIDAAHTTLILATPAYNPTDLNAFRATLKAFLDRGGRVLATDATGALLLPGGSIQAPSLFRSGLCETTPEGPGALARAGSIELTERTRWASNNLTVRVDQRCGDDAVVVHFPVGAGEAIWWSSPTPLTNAGLKHAANLQIFLTALGDNRTILWDEALHRPTRTLADTLRGLPLTWLFLQAGLVFVLIVLSFGRRRGPLRDAIRLPRSSPVEFADSMGQLYDRARATSAATDAALHRLERALRYEAGLSSATLQAGPAAIAEALHTRFGGDWTSLAEHLQAAAEAAHTQLPARTALALVRNLHHDEARIRAALKQQPELTAVP